MKHILLVLFACVTTAAPGWQRASAEADETTLPGDVKAVWDLDKAFRETTDQRERISINGLWRWQPADKNAGQVPAGNWGFFKVPGSWPGISDYMQEETQTVYPHTSWKGQKLGDITAAWYQREISVPPEWAGRRMALSVEYLNSYAAVFVDGKQVGEIRFPAGELDVTAPARRGHAPLSPARRGHALKRGACCPSATPARPRQVRGTVQRRGAVRRRLPGKRARGRAGSTDVRIDTSVRKGQISFDATLRWTGADPAYWLRTRKSTNAAARSSSSASPRFASADLKDGRADLHRRSGTRESCGTRTRRRISMC